jgi:membrane fusion protein (multidrug efflux system)
MSFTKTFALVSLLLALIGGSFVITLGRTDRDFFGDSSGAAPLTLKTSVEVEGVRIGPIREVVRAIGTLDANESVIVRPEIPGVVKRILFQEGQPVLKGAVLVELDDSELQAQLEQARAELNIAKLTYNRMKQLVGGQNAYVSQQQIDQAISAVTTAAAQHTMYLTRLSKTRIRAPFSGHVGIRRISLGDYVQTGQDLVNLEDLSTLKIDFKVPETYLNRLALGQRLEVLTDAYPDRVFTGELYAVDPRIDEQSRAARVRASISNKDVKLRPGLFVTVNLMLGENSRALLIPEEAVVHLRDKTFVYRVIADSARLTEVALGARERGLVHVVGGLGDRDSVVSVGHHKLKDGTPIQPVREQ